ncbi:MAG: phosphoribosylamine--glycine ligase [Verrucomicrobia bacterium]|nr:phosphoribosylamine--glycine ligase [Verrucomicrobiota bacterium]
MTVLVLGGGGREHALLKCCLRSERVGRVVAAPGNGGMAREAECRPVDAEDGDAVLALARACGADLVIIGPEAPLAAGVADVLRKAGFRVFGPGREAARLESSKAFCKAFLRDNGVPTAAWANFTEVAEAVAWLDRCAFPVVVKASGLAAGKGVIICEDREAAESAIREMLEERRFGESGREIVIEEFLTGQEASLMVLIGGGDYVCLQPSQDHKRIGEGDTGPNTGGMGAYAPAAVVTEAVMAKVRERILAPTMEGLRKAGLDYRGVLFVGLMIDDKGEPKVLEFNVRFGDPECQVLLPLCETDPVQLMVECAEGRLATTNLRFHEGAAMIVVLAAKGYPGSYAKGEPIGLPGQLPEGVDILHAGTRLDEAGQLLSAGGRVLGVTAVGSDLRDAADKAYAVVDKVEWVGKTFRRDIGQRQLHPTS